MLALLSGCAPTEKKLGAIDLDKVGAIQFFMPTGNPLEGTESKTISDHEEITRIVEAVNSAVEGERIDQQDLPPAGFPLRCIFFNKGMIVHQLTFYDRDTEKVSRETGWHYVYYAKETLYDLYLESSAEEMFRRDNRLLFRLLCEFCLRPASLFAKEPYSLA